MSLHNSCHRLRSLRCSPPRRSTPSRQHSQSTVQYLFSIPTGHINSWHFHIFIKCWKLHPWRLLAGHLHLHSLQHTVSALYLHWRGDHWEDKEVSVPQIAETANKMVREEGKPRRSSGQSFWCWLEASQHPCHFYGIYFGYELFLHYSGHDLSVYLWMASRAGGNCSYALHGRCWLHLHALLRWLWRFQQTVLRGIL